MDHSSMFKNSEPQKMGEPGIMAVITGKLLQSDNGEGIPNVVVSDGKTVTRTDETGWYTLEVNPERRKTTIVFAVVPEGYTVPVDEANIPQFFARIDNLKAGETREQNIVLIRDRKPEGKRGSFIFITDTHVSKYNNPSINVEKERFITQMKQLNELAYDVDFIISNGDFGGHASAEEFKANREVTAISSYMVWPVPGNHDLGDYFRDKTYKSYVQQYRSFFGPEWYSFDYRGYHIVVLEAQYGQYEAEQIEWLKQDLAMMPKGKKVIAVAHVPFNTPPSKGVGRIVEVLRQYRTELALTGHYHSNDIDPNVFSGGVHIQTAPFWAPQDGNPVGFRLISIGEDDHLSYDFIVMGKEKELTIVNPAPDQVVEAGIPLDIQVNAYDTQNKIKSVYYQIDGGARHFLQQVSSWTWTAGEEQKQSLSQGSHSIEVVVEAESNESWRKSCSFTALDGRTLKRPCSGTDWPCLHGDERRSGYTRDCVTPPLRLAWTYNSGGSILASAPVLVGETVYIGIRDENGVKNNGIAAIDIQTGKEKWRRAVDAPVEAVPAVVDGVVYFSGMRGTVYALSAETGKIIWEHRTGVKEEEAGVQQGWTQASPAVADGVVYQGLGDYLLALDAKTGEEKWRFRSEVDGHGGTDRQGSPLVDDGIAYFTGDGRYVVAVLAETGEELWKYYPTVPCRFRTGATAADGCIYLRGESGQIEAIDAKTGEYLWHYRKPYGNEGRAYIAAAGGSLIYPAGSYLVSVDSGTGQEQWSFKAGDDIESSPAVSGETVYVGSKDGKLYAIDLRTGKKLWEYTIGTWINSSPAVSGNMVIVGAYDGNVYCFIEA